MLEYILLISWVVTTMALARDNSYFLLDNLLPDLDKTRPLIVFYERYILILPQGLRLSPAPDTDTASHSFVNLVYPHRSPAIQLQPSRLPVRKPIRFPPPPPQHLLASTLLPLHEENELAGPPELKPIPPRPPPVPSASQSLSPVRPGPEPFLPPPPRKKPTGLFAYFNPS